MQATQASTDEQTATTTTTTPAVQDEPVVLHLRGETSGRRVHWSQNTVDNEHLNKKKSKICCIYHKLREFDESSSEESDSDSGSDSDSSCCHKNAYERA
ncbi:protein phosphatase inhibitor [Schizosaccharomyces japonicus yFS275]|uniref:Type 1 phosphatases regulator n=1 Tax=Schizosaccharomyces japonicus (strain yFS275 / FY16936) TaxID=402676 RepID=B6K8C1_SCHJY|nr:protein phosphatase inhibitor [Schizosaccharomyces japonicus yFS275]EEB09775.1 protein phosphatase inhibitor [Schizosaccharomyces japonicus yFS275]